MDGMLPRCPLLCDTGLDTGMATRAQGSPQGGLLGEAESGGPWRESLAANEALEPEFELFGSFRKVIVEACPRAFTGPSRAVTAAGAWE